MASKFCRCNYRCSFLLLIITYSTFYIALGTSVNESGVTMTATAYHTLHTFLKRLYYKSAPPPSILHAELRYVYAESTHLESPTPHSTAAGQGSFLDRIGRSLKAHMTYSSPTLQNPNNISYFLKKRKHLSLDKNSSDINTAPKNLETRQQLPTVSSKDMSTSILTIAKQKQKMLGELLGYTQFAKHNVGLPPTMDIKETRTSKLNQHSGWRLKRASENQQLFVAVINTRYNASHEAMKRRNVTASEKQSGMAEHCSCGTRSRFDRQDITWNLQCPPPCSCDTDSGGAVTLVDCSGQGLTTIPKIPVTSQTILLQNNNLSSIPCFSFCQLEMAERLNIAENNIADLSSGTFDGLISLRFLGLSGNGLTALHPGIFNGAHNLQELDLSSNKIQTIKHQSFLNLSKLNHLDLSNNLLAQLENDTFHGLTSLTQLDLYSNRLRYRNTTFGAAAFTGMPGLDSLILHNNTPKLTDDFQYPDLALSQVPWLRSLSLDGYPRILGPGFRNLMKLEVLDFNGIDNHCDMTTAPIPEMFFSNINTSDALDVDLSSCGLKTLPHGLFTLTPTINHLQLSKNEFGMDNFAKGSYGLQNSNLTYLDISKIRRTDEEFSFIRNYTFQYLRNTRLQILVIKHCAIVTISPQAIHDLPTTLETLNLEHNYIISGDFLFALVHLVNLKVLMGSVQISYDIVTSNPMVKNSTHSISDGGDVLQLSENFLHTGASALDFKAMLNGDDFRQAIASESSEFCDHINAFNETIKRPNEPLSIIVLPHKLEELYLSDTKLLFDIPSAQFFNNKVLRKLDYSANDIKCFGGPLTGPALEYLDLSRNFCPRVSHFMFTNLRSLKTLLLYDNVLSQSLADDVDGKIFSALDKLETLNLHNNAIKHLAQEAFSFNPNLQTLNLSQNELTIFSPNLASNPLLETLDISDNILTGFTGSSCKQLSEIKRNNPDFLVRIRNNSFLCDCANMAFITLLLQQPEIFEDVRFFRCLLANGTHVHYAVLESVLRELDLQCMLEPIFAISLLMFCLFSGVFVTLSLYHHRRWQLTYLFYVGRARLHIGSTYFNYKPIAHAFLTYDQDSRACRNFMTQQFLPRLRQEGVSYVLGETDFPPGPLTPSILGAVEATRKTLVVLSQDIFQDHHRALEVNLAIMHELHMRRPVLVPMLYLGDLDYSEAAVRNGQNQPPEDVVTHRSRDWRSLPATEADMDPLSLVEQFPSEISVFLQGQAHRCLVYDGGSEQFWQSLKTALLTEE